MKKRLATFDYPLLIGFLSFFLFVAFQARGIYGGDSGDLVTAAFEMGVPHPPGYPLYTFLGWILSRLPLFTPAWRVGLLSSIPHAIAVSFLYLTVERLTKRRVAALFAGAVLASNYLFFLYSVTPEVFALFDLFIILLIYLLTAWKQTKRITYLAWASFVFGLSLTHHHVILFFIPAIAYFLWSNKSYLRGVRPFTLLVYFLVGLLPYLYIPIAARGSAAVNWDRPVDLAGFIRLITRADYGTFVSGGFYGAHLIERALQVKGYLQLVLLDLSWVGVTFVFIGGIFFWRTSRRILFFLFLALASFGPGFFFYASFPIFNRFNWGTYERFLLPSYMIFSIFIGAGFHEIVRWANTWFGRRLPVWKAIGQRGFVLILFLYPISILGMTAWRFVGLPGDHTADNLGIDMLSPLPPASVVLVSRDTPLFTSEYARYALGVRPDIVLLHANKLQLTDYPPVISHKFPDLTIPQNWGPEFPAEFIKANRDRPIFTNTLFPVEMGWFWVPYGLLYRLTPEQKLPQMDEFYQENKKIWETFHDPTLGILSRYNHLMLSDVRAVYAAARIELAKTLLKAGKLEEAKTEIQAAIAYGGDTQVSDAYMLLGLTELFGSHCQEALFDFARARETSPAPDKFISLYEGVTLRDCTKNAAGARKLFDEYERLQKSEETPLQ